MTKAELFETVLNSVIEGVIMVDKDAKIIFMNKQASLILGIPISQAIGRHVVDAIPNTRLHIVLKTGVPETDRIQQLGHTQIITTRVPIRDSSGQIIGAVAIFRDVTSVQKMAEEVTNLRQVEALLKAIIESTSDAISVADENGKIVLVNKSYTKITGYSPSEVVGKLATVDIAQGESMHIKVAKTKQPIYGARLLVGPGKREVVVDVTPLLVKNEFKGSVAVIHDVTEIIKLNRELDEVKRLIRRMGARYTFEDVVAESSKMKIALTQAMKVAPTPATVLLRGESGTGKELFAHAIHNASDRRDRAFVSVNCAAIPESVLESELFGYASGAFTGARKEGKKGLLEEAQHGTVFFDEIGKVPLAVQSKLLRFLENREIVPIGDTKATKIDARIIAATNMDLEKMVQQGTFLPDLYFRLNVFPIFLPPLRERKEDIPILVQCIIRKLNQEYGRTVEGISPDALVRLMNYDWPGNVRELENVIGRAMINMDSEERFVKMHHLPPLKTTYRAVDVPSTGNLREMLFEYERGIILKALDQNNWNVQKAAASLGMSVRTLYYRMKVLQIRRKEGI
ncbi:MAG TPA: sigma-54-dependent Fis family transcriptional regulator [Pseudothermotoga sp.]|nr:sigma-54-dependent Fis family transcriptional regulator [Pseudothermotoga sp.]HOK82882.1 sigma-54-dependent Fis family transcriptional regulator [Pseudothermotoga sp.]HPP69945.1 sigma-54-dependent Fis family transcriptional regulator [Pseudothermotoga sp.]